MATATLPRVLKPESHVGFDDDGEPLLPAGAEFVDGQILEKPVSELSNWVGGEVFAAMRSFVKLEKLGIVFTGNSEQGYKCFDFNPRQVRKPDVSFVRRDLATFFLRDKGYTPEVPELIVEVLSPEDKVRDVSRRLEDFRRAGTKLIWVIDPEQRRAKIIHPDGIEFPVDDSGVLDGEDVLPGFSMPLASILPPKTAIQTQQ